MGKRLVIVDGNSLLNRAYYAIQRPMITKDGLYTQGIFGFLNMLNKIINDYDPSHIAIAFDRKAPTFRHKEYSEYKAGRKKMPPELAMEFQPLKEVLSAMNICILEIDGFEADDILGTISLAAEESDIETFVFTGDKDALQLASDKTTIIFTKRGITEFDLYDRAAFEDHYGITPTQFIDLKAIMGDKSDNIPGIPGVGEKTGLKLISEYGSLENLLNSVDEMKAGKLREKIEENVQLAVMSKRLATINRFVPIEFDFDDMKFREPDQDRLIEIYKKLEFNSFLKKLASAQTGRSRAEDSEVSSERIEIDFEDVMIDESFDKIKSVKTADIIILSAVSDVRDSLEGLLEAESIWLKVFHNDDHIGTPEIYSFCMGTPEHIYVIEDSVENEAVVGAFFERFKGCICGHELKKDYYALFSKCGIHEDRERGFSFDTLFDTAIAAYILDPQKKSYELSILMLEYLHQEFMTDKEIAEQTGVIDLFGDGLKNQGEIVKSIFEAEYEIAEHQLPLIAKEKLTSLFTDVELPLCEILASMERYGMKADAAALDEIGGQLKSRISELTTMIYAMSGKEFNINSPKQLGTVLFEDLGLKNGKKTKTGYSTNAAILDKIKDEHPVVPLILEYRTLSKLAGTYIDGLIPLIDKTGRIHAHFQQTVTATGRLSCTEPNLQNIPVRHEEGRRLRKLFAASGDGRTLVGADYSQVELRIMAHLSEDPVLIESFRNNEDIHRITASRVFGTEPEKVDSLQRSRAKAVNFGVIYGISSFGLSEDLKISRAEAQQYINDYFKTHPKVREYMDRCVETASEQGYVTTVMGRRRYINEIHASNHMVRQAGERLAMNTPVQGTAADIIKVAMIKVYRELNKKCPDSHLILQVHDELIIDCETKHQDETANILKDCMENAVTLKVPLSVEVNSAENWYDLK